VELTSGEVYTFKMNSAEELIAKVVSATETEVLLHEPVSVAPGPQGLGLVPSLFTVGAKSEVRLNVSSIALYALTDESVKAKYIEATSGIIVPDKKIIMG
jgi:hypothetical protein